MPCPPASPNVAEYGKDTYPAHWAALSRRLLFSVLWGEIWTGYHCLRMEEQPDMGPDIQQATRSVIRGMLLLGSFLCHKA